MMHELWSKRASEYDQEIPQAHTADQPMAPRGRATEHRLLQDTRKTVKAKQPAFFPHQDDCKARRTQSTE